MRNAREIEVRANGLRFAAYEQGDAKAPLVLCLHGFPDHARSFRHQFEPLVAAGYRVVAPYMRGYAPTERPADANYQTAALGRDVVGLIDALGAERAVVFGHDWGAIAAYSAALLAPQRLSKLVVATVPYGIAFITRFLSDYEQLKRSWYIYFFQSPIADGTVAADRCEFVRKIWRDWSPTWKLPEDELDAVRDTIAKPGGVEAAIGYYRSMLSGTGVDPALADEQAQAQRHADRSAGALRPRRCRRLHESLARRWHGGDVPSRSPERNYRRRRTLSSPREARAVQSIAARVPALSQGEVGRRCSRS